MSEEHVRRITEPDRRYLRASANRRVRKIRHMRVVLRAAGIIAVNLVVVSIVLLSGARTVRRVANSPEFALRTITVEGASRTSAGAVRGRISDLVGRNLLEIDLDETAARCAEDPWVRSASVRRELPDTLRVVIEERVPAGLAVVDGFVQVVDRTGRVIGPSGAGLDEDLPVLTGLERRQGRALEVELERGVRALQRLQESSPRWAAGISELDLSRADRIRVVTAAAGPSVLLDPEHVERNLDTYLALRDRIEDGVGPVEYVDLRWSHRLSVMQAPAASLMEKN